MAARKRGRQRPADDDEDDLGGEDGGGEQQHDSLSAAVAAESELKLKEREPEAIISRTDERTGQDEHLDTVSASVVSEDWIAETYGGGKYRVKLKGFVEGRWQYMKHLTFSIDKSLPFKGSIKSQTLRENEEREISTRERVLIDGMPPSPARGGDGFDDVIRSGIVQTMREQAQFSQLMMQSFANIMEEGRQSSKVNNEMMMTMLRQMKEDKPKVDWVQVLGVVTPILPQLLELVKRKDAMGPAEIIALIEKVKPKDEATKVEDMLNLVTKVREATEGFGGGGEGGGIAGTLGKVLEAVAPMLATRLVEPAPRQPMPPTAAVQMDARVSAGRLPITAERMRAEQAAVDALGAAASLAQPGQPIAPLGEIDLANVTADQVWALIGEHAGKLELAATLGRRPHIMAGLVVDVITPAQKAVLAEVLDTEGFDDELFTRFPNFVKRRRWVQDFLDALRDEVLGPMEDDDLPEGDGTGAAPQGGSTTDAGGTA